MDIGDPSKQQSGHALWFLAFRAGFLCAGLFAVVAMLRWLYWMVSPASWDYSIAPNWWHAHEMVFGFAMPVVAGFLLTAVATWTGTRGTTGRRLQLLFALWLTARVLLWLAPGLMLLAWAAEMLFLLLIIYELTTRVWSKRQWRNMLFPPVLLMLGILDSISFWNAQDPLLTTRLFYGTVWMITVLVVIIGGRVTPMFTGNGLGFKIPPLHPGIEYLAIGITAVIGLIAAFAPAPQSAAWFAPLCLAGCAIHSYRVYRWQSWKTFGVPLLWSMHLSYLCIPLAMLGMAIAGTGSHCQQKRDAPAGHWHYRRHDHRHDVARVTGPYRTPVASPYLPGLGFCPGTAVCGSSRWAAHVCRRAHALGMAGLCHSLDCRLCCFLWRYLPVLTRARVDGKPG